MNLHCIYKHTFPDGRVYIGQTLSGATEARWNSGKGYKGQKKVFSAIVRYGWDNIKHEILVDNVPGDQIDAIEAAYIKKYRAVELGYNVDHGGGARKPQEKEKEENRRETWLASRILKTSGYDGLLELFLGRKEFAEMDDPIPNEYDYCLFNALFMKADEEIYKTCTERSFGSVYIGGSERREYEAEMLLNCVIDWAIVFNQIENFSTPQGAIDYIRDFYVGKLALILNNLYGALQQSKENHEYVWNCYKDATERMHRRMYEHLRKAGSDPAGIESAEGQEEHLRRL